MDSRLEEKSALISRDMSQHYCAINEQTDTSTIGETLENYKARWRSIRILYLTMFFSSVEFSIVMSSLWPYLQKVDPNVSETFLGWTNAGFSLCQLIGSVVFGFWCHYRPAVQPLVFSLFVLIVGSLLYAYAQSFSTFAPYVILLGRTLLGFSAGNVAVCRAVVSQSTTLSERTVAFGNTAIAQAAGFFFGPVMQVAVVPVGNKGVYFEALKMNLNVFTAPGFLGVIMGLVNIVALLCYFREQKVDIYEGKSSISQTVQSKRKPDLKAIGVTSVIFFMCLLVFALNETILTPFVMDEFAWNSTQAVLYGGIILSVSGALSVVLFHSVKYFVKRFGERKVLVSGLVIMLAGFIVYLPWGNEYPVLQESSSVNLNSTFDVLAVKIGCPTKYSWCHDTPKVYLLQFLAAATLVSAGYALAFLVANTIYSKILGPRQQGTYMAWITSIGSLARVVGPLLAARAYVTIGPRWTFLIVDGLLAFTILLFGIYRHRLIPFHEYTRIKS